MLIKERISSFHGEQYGGSRKGQVVRKYNKFKSQATSI